MNGDNNSDEYKEGTVDDLESANCNVKYGDTFINNTNTPSTLYNTLTTAFQPLAEDISKRPELSMMLHGFIVKAQKMLCDSTLAESQKSFMQLITHTSTDLQQQIFNSMTKSNNSTVITNNSQKQVLPITRPHRIGHPKTTRYTSINESIMKASKKPRGSLNKNSHQQCQGQVHIQVKEKRQCGYCGLRDGHRYDRGCKIMLQNGYLLKKEDVENFRIKLTRHDYDIRLDSYTGPDNQPMLAQIPSKTKFLCVHGYGRIEQDGILSQSLENESNYLCVSFVFANAVIKQEYNRCFVGALAVLDWMSSSTNQKKVMIGRKQK